MQKHISTVLGLDMGGTHTDAVLVREGHLLATAKVPTRHENLLESAQDALTSLFRNTTVSPAEITRATLGTTLAVNAVIQHTVEPVGLLYAAGPGMNPEWAVPDGVQAVCIPGSLDHRGTERVPLDSTAARQAVRHWREQGISAFACVGKFSVRNPAHEKALAAAVADVFADSPEAPVVAQGHLLSGALNFPRRVATACWNAAVWRLHNHFADAVELALARAGLNAPVFLLKADGGAIPLAFSRAHPVEALLSGPAASVMGVLAATAITDDLLTLDMGGTTTDMALLAQGQPLLDPDNLTLNHRSTQVRSLLSRSIGLGGDSLIRKENGQLQAGPLRQGPAMAFGGTAPTFLDCLNTLGHAHAGDVEASRQGLAAFAAFHGTSVQEAAEAVLEQALATLTSAIRDLVEEVNSRPVYTLTALLENRRIEPRKAILVGGPAEAVAPLLNRALGIPVHTLEHAEISPVANAIGAAQTHTTASIDLFADTMIGILLAPEANLRKSIDRRYGLAQAREEACTLLRAMESPEDAGRPIDILEEQIFATLDAYGRGGRDIRIRAQLRPGVDKLVE